VPCPTLIAFRFLVALAPVRGLLLRAKHLFVEATAANCPLEAPIASRTAPGPLRSIFENFPFFEPRHPKRSCQTSLARPLGAQSKCLASQSKCLARRNNSPDGGGATKERNHQ
jgi:hypothetical protein